MKGLVRVVPAGTAVLLNPGSLRGYAEHGTCKHEIVQKVCMRKGDELGKINLPVGAWLVFLVSALLEVGGDAVVRRGLRGAGIGIILVGGLMLGGYGLLVNMVRWDFSKLLGVYVSVFALVSVMWGRFVFGETVPNSTWLGLAIIVAGGLVIQFGRHPF